MIFKKSYSFLLLPHHGHQGRSVFLGSRLLNALFTLLLAGAAVSSFLIVRHYRYHFKLVTSYEPTFQENEQLKVEQRGYGHVVDSLKGGIVRLEDQVRRERGNYVASMGSMARELDELKKLAIKVKIQAGFKTSSVVDESEPAGGPGETETSIGWHDDKKPVATAVLESRLRPGIAEQSELLTRIDAFLSTKESLISATPELAPLFGRMTSNFGTRRWRRSGHTEDHAGIDIAVPKGTPVSAPAEGVVTICDWKGDYGRMIELDHGNGYTTRFGHLSQFSVEIGDHVRKGQAIGQVGSSGRSTGPHLHYEVRLAGTAVDPIDYLGSLE